jgi:hypothetical protein
MSSLDRLLFCFLPLSLSLFNEDVGGEEQEGIGEDDAEEEKEEGEDSERNDGREEIESNFEDRQDGEEV